MTRILSCLAVVTVLALATAFGVGFWSFARSHGWLAGPPLASQGDTVYTAHFLLGLFGVLLTLAVHCLIFIYFLGTGRWVKEVALAYKLPDQPYPKLTRELKRRTFPVALFAMLIAIATAAAGMGAQRQEWPWQVHLSLATITLLVNLWAFRIEYRNVSTNVGVIDAVMHEAERLRAEAGLLPSAEELERQGSE
jgi:hypothetical protein